MTSNPQVSNTLTMGMISEKTFKDLVAERASSLLQLSRYLSQDAASTMILTRPLLGDLLSHSTQLEELLDAYYKLKGWNNDGIPTKESLHELGLDYVSEEFVKRGILSDGEELPIEDTSA